ncbi:MAG: ABC transporter permease [Candidatus Andersenbacteria bacterium]|nr:ABC transporter permease [Candidatus Andersenbacteria bacterium]MBI3250881.1 ABC transporter permease [Candidatus Andersenbacteria bacterium]
MKILTYKTRQVKAQEHSSFYWLINDLSVFIERSLKHIFKNKDQLLGLTVQPIMFMMLFRYVFGGAINTGGTTYVNFLVAGILIQSVAFGALTTSLSVATDLQRGIIERFKSLPTVSWGVLMGHVSADLVRNILQSVIMIGVGMLVGFRPTASVTDWFAIAGLILLFTFAISWVAAIMGLVAKTIEAVQWLGFFIIFPFTFASAAFAPTDSMPYALRLFAENQPVTHIIEAVRALMIGTPVGNHIVLSIIWFTGITIIAIPIASYLFRQYSGR